MKDQSGQSAKSFENHSSDNWRVNATLFDRTNGASTGFSERLNGSTNEKYGVAKSISVMPGDVINAQVYGKYVDSNTSNWTGALTTLMSQIAANTAGVVVDGATYSSSTSTFPFTGLLSTTGSTGGPKAYINWLIFDRNYTLLNGGYTRMSATPKEQGQDVAHELMTSPTINITQPGYVYIYLSNEETTPVEVYFDDFRVTHVKSPVMQTDDYYPFGLTFNSYQRENSAINRWKFQGQEHVDDLGLSWDSFKWRNHQPEIGRFFGVDPLAEKYVYNSPYAFSENKVVVHIELEGLEAVYVFDSPARPKDNGTQGSSYTGEVFVVGKDGNVNGPYSGSSYPNSVSSTDNSPKFNTINEGSHKYNNASGHSGSKMKGLNIDDSSDGTRKTNGKTPSGADKEMQYVNVHSGYSNSGGPASRGSKGCITIKPSQVDAFMSNFDWSGSITVTEKKQSTTYTGTTGNASGEIAIFRGGDTAEQAKKNLQDQQRRSGTSIPAGFTSEIDGAPIKQ